MCTSLILKDTNEVAHVGRTMELTMEEPWHLMYVPAGHSSTSQNPDGSPGLAYTSKYPVLGVATPLHLGLGNWFVQGFNDQGLVGSVQSFDETTAVTRPARDTPLLAATDIHSYALGSCRTVA